MVYVFFAFDFRCVFTIFSTKPNIGCLIQVPEDRGRFRRRLSSFKGDREAVRQCFLFSNYIIIATRYGHVNSYLPDLTLQFVQFVVFSI